MTSIRLAEAGDAGAIGEVFGAGFEDDPVLSWVFAEPGRRLKLAAMFTFLLAETFIPPGTTYVTDGAAAAWRPPGQPQRDEAYGERLYAAVSQFATAEDFGRLAAMGVATEAAHPTEAHWYLGVVATLPERRAQGLGTALLAGGIEMVDAVGGAAYLESSNLRNLTLYERHGFEATGRIDIAEGVFMTPMWRPAR